MKEEKKRLLIIDSNSLIHRAYHALPFLTTKKGEVINAVYGFLLVFLKVLREIQPDFVVAAFDVPAPTFRHKEFKEYKAKRPPTPEQIIQQIPKIKEILKIFNVPIVEKEGFEADDIIGTISRISPKKQIIPKLETIILSGDLDPLQLVDDNTKVYALKKGLKDTFLYNEEKVKERYGLSPRQLIDYKALRGDSSDNIPGVFGIGEKTAIDLIKKFQSLEGLYQEIEAKTEKSKDIKQPLKEKLIKSKEQAFLSKTLAEIKRDVPIDFDFKTCRWGDYDKEKVIQSFRELEFHSLIGKLRDVGEGEAPKALKLL